MAAETKMVCKCGDDRNKHDAKGQRFEYRKRFPWSKDSDALYTLACAQFRAVADEA